jgi:hypothetical protein
VDPDPQWYSAKKLDQDPDLVNPDPKHWVLGPTHLISAAPGSADTYIPVGTVPTHLISAAPGSAETYLPVGTGSVLDPDSIRSVDRDLD